MLTSEAYNDHKWESLPLLRQILEAKQSSASHFGSTSVSDNVLDALRRTLEIILLACECEADLMSIGQGANSKAIISELVELDHALQAADSFISDARRQLKRLTGNVDQVRLSELGRLTPMPLLEVDRAEFLDGVAVLAGMTKRNRMAKAMLAFKDGLLSIKVGSTAIDVHATGHWSGLAKANGQAFLLASRDLPATDSVILKVEDDRLLIDRRSVRCDWSDSKTPKSKVKQ